MGQNVRHGRPSGQEGPAAARLPLLRVLPFLGLIVLGPWVGPLCSGPDVAVAEFRVHLDPAFAKWLDTTPAPSYSELARRFVDAGGRDAAAYDERMSKLTDAFREHVRKQGDPDSATARVALLRDWLFRDRGFRADLDLENTDNLFPDAILSRKQGFCLGLSLLLADLGERLGWPLEVAAAPRHTFVRYRTAGGSINLETTLAGKSHGDEWYRKRYRLTGERATLLKRLTPKETAAHLINNHGFALLQKGFLVPARRELDGSLKVSPGVVEARINLGVLEARNGAFDAAIAHFEQALVAWPEDGYLLLNCLNAHLAMDDTLGAAVRAIELSMVPERPEEFEEARAEVVRRLLAAVDEGKNWRLLQRLVTAENAKLAEAYGKKPGLVGTYYSDQDLAKRAFSRVDRDLSFRWSWESPGKGVPRDRFSIRWEGWFEAPHADEYGWFVTCSDGIRIWVDDRLVVDSWRRANDNFPRGKVSLDPGLHTIRVEYFEAVGEAGVSLIVTAKKEERPLDLPKHLWHGPGSSP